MNESTPTSTNIWDRMDAHCERHHLPLLAAIAATGVVARVGAQLVLAGSIDPESMDSQNYLAIAHNLAEQGEFSTVEGTPTAFVAPGYPALLALLQQVFGDPVWAARLLQALIGGLSSLAVFALVRHFYSVTTALLAALIWALHPELCGTSVFLYGETVFLALFLLALLALQRSWTRWQTRWALATGILMALATLVRPVTLLLMPALAVAATLRAKSRGRALLWSLTALAAFVSVISPWSLRNYRCFGRVIPVAAGGGSSLWQGMYLPFDGRFRYEETQERIAQLAGPDTPPEDWDPILTRDILRSMKDHPLESAWLAIRKMGRFLFEVYEDVPRGAPRSMAVGVFWPLSLTHWALLALAAVGAIFDFRRGARFGVLYVVVAYFVGLHSLMVTVPRYRLPILPIIVALAAVGAVALLRRACGATSASLDGSGHPNAPAAPSGSMPDVSS
ncbi:MAG: glycosyltransferase family 39 protein [Planctomycetota bacterium]